MRTVGLLLLAHREAVCFNRVHLDELLELLFLLGGLPPNPTSAVEGRKPLENQGPVVFSVTIRLAPLPGFYWTHDL